MQTRPMGLARFSKTLPLLAHSSEYVNRKRTACSWGSINFQVILPTTWIQLPLTIILVRILYFYTRHHIKVWLLRYMWVSQKSALEHSRRLLVFEATATWVQTSLSETFLLLICVSNKVSQLVNTRLQASVSEVSYPRHNRLIFMQNRNMGQTTWP